MIRLKNIHSLSDFQRNTKSHIARLKKSGEPAILTINGEAHLVVLSAEAYQKLLATLELAELLNTAHQGALESLRAGEISAKDLMPELVHRAEASSLPAKEAFAELERRIHGRRKKKAS